MLALGPESQEGTAQLLGVLRQLPEGTGSAACLRPVSRNTIRMGSSQCRPLPCTCSLTLEGVWVVEPDSAETIYRHLLLTASPVLDAFEYIISFNPPKDKPHKKRLKDYFLIENGTSGVGKGT